MVSSLMTTITSITATMIATPAITMNTMVTVLNVESQLTLFSANLTDNYEKTRKPCYRKDDRAMRPIYGCPEKLPESSQTPPATFPKICKVLLFRTILRMSIQNLKFVALSVPEIIGVLKKFGQFLYTPTLQFLPNF